MCECQPPFTEAAVLEVARHRNNVAADESISDAVDCVVQTLVAARSGSRTESLGE